MTESNKSSIDSRVTDAILSPLAACCKLVPTPNIRLETTLSLPDGTQLLHFRADIGPQTPTASTVLAAPTTITKTGAQGFPEFNRLPPEIRRMIWELSFGPPRVFQTAQDSSLKALIPTVVNHKPPPAMQACREARAVTLEVGTFRFGVRGKKIKSLWYRKAVDIFYWRMESCPIPNFNFPEDEEDGGNDGNWGVIHLVGDIETVAFDFQKDSSQSLYDVGLMFPGCKSLLVVLPHPTQRRIRAENSRPIDKENRFGL